jgi:hypothetical protein
MKKSLWFATLCAAALVAGCSSMKEPATQAISAAESSLATVKEAAAKYAPEALAPVESQLTALKDSLAKGDFKAVMAGAPGLTSAISSLGDTVKAKQAEFEAATGQWTSLAADLPNMVTAIQSRVDMLSKSKMLPAAISKDAFASAKSGLDELKSSWNDASAAATSGNVLDAVAKAQAIKAKGAEIMAALGMKTG